MKIATVPYTNSLPLTYGLNNPLLQLDPAAISEALLQDQIDVALVPAYTIIRHNLRMHPEAGLIGCDGPVKSVGFFTRNYIEDLSEIRSIYLDKESRSSSFLAKIILKKFYNVSLYDLEFFHEDNRDLADAQVLIGDKALHFQRADAPYKYWDIGEIWKQNTGAGFLFACWASKRELSQSELLRLKRAREEGQAHLSEIIASFDREQQGLMRDYLSHCVRYTPSENINKGFKLYKDYLAEYQYSSLEPKPVRCVA